MDAIANNESREDMEARHRKEIKDLTAKTTAMKKTATKGEKRKKKEILAEIAILEANLKAKHEEETKQFETMIQQKEKNNEEEVFLLFLIAKIIFKKKRVRNVKFPDMHLKHFFSIFAILCNFRLKE